jgi:Trypsin-like peptidase domain
VSKKSHKKSHLPSIRAQIASGRAADAIEFPSGRVPSNRRRFEEVVADLRPVVYSIMRIRALPGGQSNVLALGSGFFFSPTMFLTCHHVLNSTALPHQDGDIYQLVNNLVSDGSHKFGRIENIASVSVGNNLFLFPESDLAVLKAAPTKPQRYAALDFGDLEEGKEIGICGYPLPRLHTDSNGAIAYDGLLFRVARNVVTGIYHTNIAPDQGMPMTNLPLLEVNFLFVPGNSGGPIFDAETGRVVGFVHGYQANRIREEIAQSTFTQMGVNRTFIESVHAVYSVGIRLERVRKELEQLGASL